MSFQFSLGSIRQEKTHCFRKGHPNVGKLKMKITDKVSSNTFWDFIFIPNET